MNIPWLCAECGSAGVEVLPSPLSESELFDFLKEAHSRKAPGCESKSLNIKVLINRSEWRGVVSGWCK